MYICLFCVDIGNNFIASEYAVSSLTTTQIHSALNNDNFMYFIPLFFFLVSVKYV